MALVPAGRYRYKRVWYWSTYFQEWFELSTRFTPWFGLDLKGVIETAKKMNLCLAVEKGGREW